MKKGNSMAYFDTHAHLDDEKFSGDREDIIKKIKNEDISLVLNCGSDMHSSENSVRLAAEHDFIYAAVGVHPHDTESMTEEDIKKLTTLADEKKVVAIGEIGLDYHYDNSPRDIQKKWFARQIYLAKELNKPYIVHDREAHGDSLDIIKSIGYTKGVMHCFSGGIELARQMLDLGFYISLAGPVTFKNAKKTKEVAQFVPLEKLLIETDCPYLAPEPHRGERNDSSYVKYVAMEIAALRGMDVSSLGSACMENGKRLFNITD